MSPWQDDPPIFRVGTSPAEPNANIQQIQGARRWGRGTKLEVLGFLLDLWRQVAIDKNRLAFL